MSSLLFNRPTTGRHQGSYHGNHEIARDDAVCDVHVCMSWDRVGDIWSERLKKLICLDCLRFKSLEQPGSRDFCGALNVVSTDFGAPHQILQSQTLLHNISQICQSNI